MTKQRDFLNALKNPIHTAAKLALRNLRKSLKEEGYRLKYRYDKKQNTFYFICKPSLTAWITYQEFAACRIVTHLDSVPNTHLCIERLRGGDIIGDLYTGAGGFLV